MASTVGAATYSKGTFATADGVELFEQSWEIQSPKAAVVIVHGLGEHSARYAEMAARFNQEGYAVYTYDQRGHGNSPGKQGYVAKFKRMPDDLDVFIGRVRSRLDGIPLFLMGHSMGGLVLASHALKYQPDAKGLVFSSSALKAGDNVKPLLQKVSGLLSVIAPRLPVHQLDPAAISRDQEEVRKYEEDPLVHHGKMLARTGGELMAAMSALQGHFGEIRLPFIALHGTADTLVDCAASRCLFDEAGSEDKTLKIYEGAYHEVFNDHDREKFLTDLIDWLNAHC